ncbi:MAG: ATP synthase F1 subunit epsilon [Oscillospiraceae bacterium]|nr:ATP synthase F1 subunit epsilon [Oscillospiraceae bacterium]MCD8376308.1 ATP synthase F1 subunit epsilon [Oscillospiraceae bacterium]
MREFHVAILACGSSFYEGPCVSLVVPTVDGLYGIQAGHSNLITAIRPGPLSYTVPDQPKRMAAVSSGLLKVEGGRVLVLVDTAERPEDIDMNRALQDAAAAKEALLQKRSMQEYHTAQASLSRALNRLRVKNHAGQ